MIVGGQELRWGVLVMFPDEILHRARALIAACEKKGAKMAMAESCTGGLIGASLTAVAGSSAVVERGFITYSNEAKMALLGVPEALLISHGAVSPEVAMAMAEGALTAAPVQLSVAVTGIAGPGGGTEDKPVGTVHIAAAGLGAATLHEHNLFNGDRDAVRLATVEAALGLAHSCLKGV